MIEIDYRSRFDVDNFFLAALHASFMHHLPFELRPDDLWLIIEQGVANHVNLNPEEFRAIFVDYTGKKKIVVRDDNLRMRRIKYVIVLVFMKFL